MLSWLTGILPRRENNSADFESGFRTGAYMAEAKMYSISHLKLDGMNFEA